MTGIAGGLVSSTAVTLSLARMARDSPTHTRLLVAGMLAASTTMICRVLVIVGVSNVDVLLRILSPLVAAGAVLVVGTFVLMRKTRQQTDGKNGIDIRNPFDLLTVLKLGAVLTVLLFATKLATLKIGATGAYALAAISGLVDVDAISLSMARLGGGTISVATAANAVLLAIGVNTIAKSALAWFCGRAATGRLMLLISTMAIGAAVMALATGVAS